MEHLPAGDPRGPYLSESTQNMALLPDSKIRQGEAEMRVGLNIIVAPGIPAF